jgi:Zn-dependent protease
MALLSLVEILDVIIMSACIGYIFSGYFSRFNIFRKPRDYAQMYLRKRFVWSDFYFSILLVGPAIILHELGHKFVAIGFGYDATFFSAISINKIFHGMPFFDFASILMIIALVSTYFGGSFLFFVPAYVAFGASPEPAQILLIAFAGPFVNLLLWLIPQWLVRQRRIPQKYTGFALITSKINMLLFIFNMIPLPGFDGAKVFSSLIRILF